MAWLAGVLILGTAISAYVYFKIVRAMFVPVDLAHVRDERSRNPLPWLAVAVCAVMTFALGVFPLTPSNVLPLVKMIRAARRTIPPSRPALVPRFVEHGVAGGHTREEVSTEPRACCARRLRRRTGRAIPDCGRCGWRARRLRLRGHAIATSSPAECYAHVSEIAAVRSGSGPAGR